jgi:cytochrome c biogenesis protein CcmG, thiol:disulfide interchange protein DsbE
MTTPLTRFALPVVLSVLAAVVGCGGSGKGAKSAADASGDRAGHAEVGKAAPDLAIQTLNGKGKISLESLQGKTVIVDFWATWCGPCKQSFPKLDELSKRLGDKVEVVGISVDDDKKGVVEFAKENGATFAIGWDDGHAIAEKWKVGTMPTTFIVDGSGKVRFIHDGYHEGETKTMEKEIASIADESSSNTKVAKSDEKKSDERSADKGKDDDKKKDDAKKDEATASAAPSSSSEDDKSEPPPPPKKKGAKKGGRAGGKAAPAKKPKKKAG